MRTTIRLQQPLTHWIQSCRSLLKRDQTVAPLLTTTIDGDEDAEVEIAGDDE